MPGRLRARPKRPCVIPGGRGWRGAKLGLTGLKSRPPKERFCSHTAVALTFPPLVKGGLGGVGRKTSASSVCSPFASNDLRKRHALKSGEAAYTLGRPHRSIARNQAYVTERGSTYINSAITHLLQLEINWRQRLGRRPVRQSRGQRQRPYLDDRRRHHRAICRHGPDIHRQPCARTGLQRQSAHQPVSGRRPLSRADIGPQLRVKHRLRCASTENSRNGRQALRQCSSVGASTR